MTFNFKRQLTILGFGQISQRSADNPVLQPRGPMMQLPRGHLLPEIFTPDD